MRQGDEPGDRFSLPYFAVADVAEALARVQALAGEVIHQGEQCANLPGFRGKSLRLARS